MKRRVKYEISQELIDDVLSSELKDFIFPCTPVYNPKLRAAYGITRAIKYSWGQTKVTSIEIGK